MTLPHPRLAVLAVFVFLLSLWAGYAVIDALPYVDVFATVEDGRVVFNIPHHGTSLLSFDVEDSAEKPLWHVGLASEKGHRIYYGTLPTGGNMPATQAFPVAGKPPKDIRGKRVIVRLVYTDGSGGFTNEFEKVLDIGAGKGPERPGAECQEPFVGRKQ